MPFKNQIGIKIKKIRFVEVCSRNYASEKQENHDGILTFRDGRVCSFDVAFCNTKQNAS